MTVSPAPQGAEELEKAGMEKMFDALQNDPDPHIRRYVAYLLGKNGDPRVIPLLITALSDPDKGVREQSALALSDIGKAAIEPLKKAMEDPKWETRYRAVEALGKIADQQVVSPLIQALKDEQNHVRYMAAKGLQELRNSQSIDPLIALLSDENEYVRIVAVNGLAKIGGAKIHDAFLQALAKEKSERVKNGISEAMK